MNTQNPFIMNQHNSSDDDEIVALYKGKNPKDKVKNQKTLPPSTVGQIIESIRVYNEKVALIREKIRRQEEVCEYIIKKRKLKEMMFPKKEIEKKQETKNYFILWRIVEIILLVLTIAMWRQILINFDLL